jgi:hypothetical protein
MPNINYLQDYLEDFTYACEFQNQEEINRIRERIFAGLQMMESRASLGENIRPNRTHEYDIPDFVYEAQEAQAAAEALVEAAEALVEAQGYAEAEAEAEAVEAQARAQAQAQADEIQQSEIDDFLSNSDFLGSPEFIGDEDYLNNNFVTMTRGSRGQGNFELLFEEEWDDLSMLIQVMEQEQEPVPEIPREPYFPKSKVLRQAFLKITLECSICLLDKTKKELVETTCCRNHYCGGCLEKWVNSKHNRSCPTCRGEDTKWITFRARKSRQKPNNLQINV